MARKKKEWREWKDKRVTEAYAVRWVWLERLSHRGGDGSMMQ